MFLVFCCYVSHVRELLMNWDINRMRTIDNVHNDNDKTDVRLVLELL